MAHICRVVLTRDDGKKLFSETRVPYRYAYSPGAIANYLSEAFELAEMNLERFLEEELERLKKEESIQEELRMFLGPKAKVSSIQKLASIMSEESK